MCDFFLWLFYEETSAYQLTVAIRPNKNYVAITKNVACCDNTVWVNLFKLVIFRLQIILKVGNADNFNPIAEAIFVVVHTIAEISKVAKSLGLPVGIRNHLYAPQIPATFAAITCSNSRA